MRDDPNNGCDGDKERSETVVVTPIENLRSYQGNCNENVTLKLNFALSQVFCDYSMLFTLYKIGELHFRWLGTNGFHVKTKSERFYCCELALLSEPKI